jgi:hypothetical protein
MAETKKQVPAKPPVSPEVKQVRELRGRVERLERVVEALARGNLHNAQEELQA